MTGEECHPERVILDVSEDLALYLRSEENRDPSVAKNAGQKTDLAG